MRRFGSALALSLVLVLGLAAVQAQEVQVGVAAAVNPAITGKPPISDKRALLVGTNVFHDELIVTEATGQAQMLFLDESALTIGPNSEVVLDEYVYDPEQKTGRLVLNATKGVFRLVGGRISKKTPVVLNTPTATIGIRGGISIINVAANRATDATFLFGDSVSVTSGGVTKQALRPGYTISVAAPDAAPSDPAPTTPETLNAALGSGAASSTPPTRCSAPMTPAPRSTSPSPARPSRTAFSTSRSRAASRHRLRPGASRSQRPSSPSARAS